MRYPTVAELVREAPAYRERHLPPSYRLQHEAANDAAELRAGLEEERREFLKALKGWDGGMQAPGTTP